MNKKLLEQINSTKIEIQDLEDRIEKLKNENIPTTIDNVQGSSQDFPYTKRNFSITGFNNIKYSKNKKARNTYKKLINSNKTKLEKLINELEYELKKIEDSEIRQIIRYKYEDNMNYIQIAHKMNKSNNKSNKKIYTEEAVRKKVERFLKNL